MLTLWIVRHGETQLNVEDRYGGRMDVPLTSKGLQQADELAKRLQNQHFDVMLCSPLKRARQTAEAISNTCHLDSIIIDDLAERNLGVYEGLTKAEIQVRYPDLYVSNCTHLVDGAPTGGESQREFERRIRRVLSEIKQLYDGKQVLLVTHGFVAMMINKIMKRLSFDEMYAFHMGNGEIISYTLTS